jgi:hypothetical protein
MQDKSNSGLAAVPGWAWLFVAAFWLVPLLGAPFGGLNLDTARDMYWAWQVASGQEFPLSGPMIGFFVHLGPIWFYTLAVPLVFHGSYTSAALFVTALAGVKYPLALYLGSRLVDWRVGLLWASILALPSLSYVTQLAIGHFSLVEGTLLVFLICCLWDHERRGLHTAFLAGLSFSIMIHAHPTTVTLGWLFPFLLWNRSRDWWKAIAPIAAGGIVPFLPLLFQQVGNQGQDLQAVVTYLKSDLVFARLIDAPALLFNTIAVGVPSAWRLAANGFPALIPVGFVVLAVLGVAGLAGLYPAWRDVQLRKWLVAGLVGFLLFGLQVSLLRVDTWWYMMLGSLPFLALFWSVSLFALMRWRNARFLPPTVAAIAAAMLLVHNVGLMRTGMVGGQHYHPMSKLKNLKAPEPYHPKKPAPWLPYLHLDEMADVLCAQSGPVVVHGALALQADSAGGTATNMRCGRAGEVYVRGRPEGEVTHLMAFGPGIVEALPFSPDGRIGSFGRYPVARSIYPEAPEPLASARHYKPREWARGLSERRVVEFTTRADERLVVSNPLIWWWEMRLVSVQAQSSPAEEVARDAASTVYACADCADDAPVSWRVEYLAAQGHALDVVSVSPEPTGQAPLGPRDLAVTTQPVE